jgi:four helix bundle protein
MAKIERFQDLVAWQLSMELADHVDSTVCSGPAARNQGFCEQIQKSSAKPAAQIAEGFLRFRPKESAYYYRVAKASLGETQTHLIRGFRRGDWPEEVFNKAWSVSQGALNTTGGLLSSRLILIAREERQKRRTNKPDPPK